MEKQLRLFIAVELPAEIHMSLGKIINKLKLIDSSSFKWVNPGNIHLTLKFLGDTSPKDVSDLQEVIKTSVKNTHPFSFRIGGTGFFPTPQNPRVLWVGMENSPQLINLQKKLDENLKSIGYLPEKRGFSPHLTLARINEPIHPLLLQSIKKSLETINADNIGMVEVDHITLFRSTLSPTGSIYNVITRIPFL